METYIRRGVIGEEASAAQRHSAMRRYLLIIFSIIIIAVDTQAQGLVYPEIPAPVPLERTNTQKAISASTDVLALALPAATLVGVCCARDWQGLKQGVFTALAAGGATLILKFSIREQRPDHSNFHSFPSGHSAVTFASAAFLQRRYGWKFGGPAYALATYTAVGRVIGKKHHWWDVVAGAAIGAASAYIFTTEWAKAHEVVMAPTAIESPWGQTGVGVTASMTF